MNKLALVCLMAAMPLMAEELKLGKPIDVANATAIHALLAMPEGFVGQMVRIEGVITDVCTDMGCWIKIKDAKTDEVLQVKVEDGVIVFPKEAKGKKAMAQGKFTAMSGADGKKSYRIQGEGAVIQK